MDDLLREFLTETSESLDTVDNQLVRFEQEYQPSNYFALGLKFHSVEVNGNEVHLHGMKFQR